MHDVASPVSVGACGSSESFDRTGRPERAVPTATEDVPLTLAYFELLAQSAGLGTVWCGLLKLALKSVPKLKSLVDLPANYHYYAMLFGRPAVHYVRTVQRDNAAKIKRM